MSAGRLPAFLATTSSCCGNSLDESAEERRHWRRTTTAMNGTAANDFFRAKSTTSLPCRSKKPSSAVRLAALTSPTPYTVSNNAFSPARCCSRTSNHAQNVPRVEFLKNSVCGRHSRRDLSKVGTFGLRDILRNRCINTTFAGKVSISPENLEPTLL